MTINSQDIDTMARLSRLHFSTKERSHYAADLNQILDLVAQFDTVDTSAITPLAHPLDQTQRLREDKVTSTGNTAEYQRLCEHTADALYLVPKVID